MITLPPPAGPSNNKVIRGGVWSAAASTRTNTEKAVPSPKRSREASWLDMSARNQLRVRVWCLVTTMLQLSRSAARGESHRSRYETLWPVRILLGANLSTCRLAQKMQNREFFHLGK